MTRKPSFWGFHPRYAAWFAGLFLVEAGIAIGVHDAFVRPYGGDVLVVMLVYCALRTVVARPWTGWPVVCFLFAVGVEISQYVHLIDHLGWRHSAVARAFLGVAFDPRDIVCYAVGLMMIVFLRRMRVWPA